MPTFAEWARGGESDHWLKLGKIRHTIKRVHPATWTRSTYYVAEEVKRQLRRTRLVPAIPAKDYKAWAKGETRPRCTKYYDGHAA